MGGEDAFSFSIRSVPFIVVALELLVLGIAVLLIRGNAILRLAAVLVAFTPLPWAIGTAITASCTDPALVYRITRVYHGPIALFGPMFFFLILAFTGLYERYRGLLALSVLFASLSCILTWTTDLVVLPPWRTSWGLWFPVGGVLNAVHVSNFVIWTGLGLYLAHKRANDVAQRARVQFSTARFRVIMGFSIFGVTDSLLAIKVGVFPFSFLPIAVAVGVAIDAVLRRDLLHSRGFDRAMAAELLVFAVVLAAISGLGLAAVHADGIAPIALAGAALVIFACGQIAIGWARKQYDVAPVVGTAIDVAVAAFTEHSVELRSERELAKRAAELFEVHHRLRVRNFYIADEENVFREPLGGEAEEANDGLTIDPRVRAWLAANAAPMVADDLPMRRLGGLRTPIEAFLQVVDADVVVPLVDRDALVGILTVDVEGWRTLDEREQTFMREAATVSARSLTYIRLYREAKERADVAREVEVAAAVQEARAAGTEIKVYAGCSVTGHYEPAAQFSGDWWVADELPDGRVFVAVGDVTGRGVSAALVSATMSGACETAHVLLGAGFDAHGLLQILNESVRSVGSGSYAMTCFVAVFDLANGRVTYANAGYPFPYRVRAVEDQAKAELRSLVCRGTVLGSATTRLATASMDAAPGDLFVFYSDALVQSRNAAGEDYGERRFQRVLKSYASQAGERASEIIMDDARSHIGANPITDDIVLVSVRLGFAPMSGIMRP